MIVLSRLLCLVCIALLGYTVIRGFTPEPESSPMLTVHEPDRDLGNLPVGVHEVRFKVENSSSLPLRILGSVPVCGLRSCFTPQIINQIAIPPHATIQLECQLEILSPGEFSCPCTLYLEDGGIRSVKLSVRGIGIASPAARQEP